MGKQNWNVTGLKIFSHWGCRLSSESDSLPWKSLSRTPFIQMRGLHCAWHLVNHATDSHLLREALSSTQRQHHPLPVSCPDFRIPDCNTDLRVTSADPSFPSGPTNHYHFPPLLTPRTHSLFSVFPTDRYYYFVFCPPLLGSRLLQLLPDWVLCL